MVENPIGCASKDLQECLLIQAQAMEGYVPLVELSIKNHLQDLMKKDYKTIAKELGSTPEQIKSAEMVIHSFHSKPGRLVSLEETHYVTPDIYVKFVGDELVVQLNDEGVPRLRVSMLYQSLLKNLGNKSETSEYVLDKVAHAIVKYQPKFFKKGPAPHFLVILGYLKILDYNICS